MRAYTEWPAVPEYERTRDIGPWPFYLFFDCETLTDQSQRLRFGTYIWCQGTHAAEKGFFYDLDTLKQTELQLLKHYADRYGYELITRDEFVDEVLLGMAYALGARIIGFNLGFDLSRLTDEDPKPAKGRMRGGFTFELRSQRWVPKIRTRQITRRLSFTEFRAVYRGRTTRAMRKRKQKPAPPRRGYFVDLKTLGGALLAGNFSLATLGEALGIEHGKLETEEHGRRLSVDYLTYAMRDVELTAECFWRLKTRFEQLGLKSISLESAFSEASVGKAHFRDMGIEPFLEVQPDFPSELLGIAMSTFYGGRSEVHIRRVISQIAYCDVLSMYPSVFVLMGLFDWVTSKGVTWRDATAETRTFLETLSIDRLLDKKTWPELTALVRVELADDTFPVRGLYGDDPNEEVENNTIGLNRAKADGALWYTLADCAVSTILNGRPPRVAEALQFSHGDMQDGLQTFSILQNPAYQIDPTRQNFFKRVIELRQATKAEADKSDEPLKARLGVEENFLKILANSTGYGIFAQFISEALGEKRLTACYGPNGGFRTKASKRERPGDFFHPLLATFITGAARLMLALAEKLALDAGLDWAFCDTDSMAFVKPDAISQEDFQQRVKSIIDQFARLNPYAFSGSLLKMEKENFIETPNGPQLHPLYVLPISAKRYVAFNVDEKNRPIIRKASTHGVGHYVAPYKEKDAPASIPAPKYELKDVDRWEHDLWYLIAKAALDGDLRRLDLTILPGFNKPAACQYTASSYDRWKWFDGYNETQPPTKRVRPGNFLLTFQVRPEAQNTSVRMVIKDITKKKTREAKPKPIHPVAPFHRDPAIAAKQAFDRETGLPVAKADLLTYAEVFRDYPHHAENKFLNGGAINSGRTERRCVFIRTKDILHIGKESNEYEEEVHSPAMAELIANYGTLPPELHARRSELAKSASRFGYANLADQAGVSRQTVSSIAHGRSQAGASTRRKLKRAMTSLAADQKLDVELVMSVVRSMIVEKRITLRELARQIKKDPSNLAKVVAGKRRLSNTLLHAIARFLEEKVFGSVR